MPGNKNWVLTDTSERTWVESIELDSRKLGLGSGARASVRKLTLKGGLCDGVDMIEVDNGALSFTVLPTRGMGIWRADYKGLRVGWDSPVCGPVHPKFVNLHALGGLGWLAGFDEMMVRCGMESVGAPCTDLLPGGGKQELTLHGRIAGLPAHRVEVFATGGRTPEIGVRGTIDEASLFGPRLRLSTTITTGPGSNRLAITDEITNMKGLPCEMEMLYHCNFGPPFLGKGSSLLLPASEAAPRDARAAEDAADWPRYLGPTAGYAEQCYYFIPLGDEAGWSVALLRNAAGDKGVAVRFAVNELPCFTQWKRTAAEADGYVTGLEPGTNYPNPRHVEREHGRLKSLKPGATYRARLAIEAHGSAAGVGRVEKEIAAIQKRGGRMKLDLNPRKGLCPVS